MTTLATARSPAHWFARSEHEARIKRVQKALTAKRYDALLGFMPETVTWTTGFFTRGYGTYQFVIIPAAGEPTLFCRDVETYYVDTTSHYADCVTWADGGVVVDGNAEFENMWDLAVAYRPAGDGSTPVQERYLGFASKSTTVTFFSSPDGVTYNGGAPFTFTINEAIGQNGIRHGRLRLQSAHGSEVLDLPAPLTLQTFDGTNFVTTTDDSCTAVAVADFTYVGVPVASAVTPFAAGEGSLDWQCSLGSPCATGFVDVTGALGVRDLQLDAVRPEPRERRLDLLAAPAAARVRVDDREHHSGTTAAGSVAASCSARSGRLIFSDAVRGKSSSQTR